MQPAVIRKGPLLALLAASQFVVVLDASITNVALPSIGRDLDLSQDSLSWVDTWSSAASCCSAGGRRPIRPPPGLLGEASSFSRSPRSSAASRSRRPR